jgi:hypothetical protein
VDWRTFYAAHLGSTLNPHDRHFLVRFYDRTCNQCGGRFETNAAILAGDAVREELQKSAAGERRE